MKEEPKYFVYVDGSQGPQPQIWNGKQTDGNGKDKPFLFIKQLSVLEQDLTLDQLTEIYKLGHRRD